MYQSYGYNPTMAYGAGAPCGRGYNFTTLVALILIVLTFSNRGLGERDGGARDGFANKGILFIIAFFFLACGCGGGCGWTGFGR